MDPSVLDEEGGCKLIKRVANTLVGGLNDQLCEYTIDRRYVAFFGTTMQVTYLMWCMVVVDIPDYDFPGVIFVHLLWTLMFLKTYQPVNVLAARCKVDEKTYRKYLWQVLEVIAGIESIVS